MPKETTTKMKVDISELTAQFQNAKKQIALVNSEFKAATAGMGKWTDSADGVSAKITQLNKVLEAEESKLDSLEKQYKLIVAEQGKNSKSAQDLAIKINNQKATVEKTRASLEGYQSKLDDMKKSAAAASTATNKLTSTIDQQESELNALKTAYSDAVLEQGKHSKQARALSSEIKKLSGSLQKNKSDLSDAESAGDKFDRTLHDVKDSSEKASGGFTIMKGALASLLADGIKTVVTGLAELASSTQEYREDMGKLETAWESAGKSTKLATDTYKEFYSVLGEEDRSVEAVNHLAKFVDTEKDMAKWTDIATGVWGTFGDSLPIEGLTEAANETAKVGQVTGPLADALNWAGVSEDKFNESLEKCNSEQERAQLITDTLNGLYSTAAEKYKENNASIIEARKANSDYTDSMAELGARVEPITTKVREGFNKILQKILELTSGVDMESFGATIDKAFNSFINTVIPAIVNGLTWIKDNKDVIVAGITAIGAAFLAFKVVTLIQGVVAALKGMTLAQAALNLVMSMNPIGLVVAAVAALIAGFVMLWKKSDGFRNFWIGLWDGIKKVVGTVVDWIKENWQTMLLFLVNPLAGIFKYCYEHFDGFRNFVDGVVKNVKQFFVDLWEGIKNIFSTISTWFNDNVIKPIKTFFEPFIHNMKVLITGTIEIIKVIFSKIANWINVNVITPVKKFFTDLWNGVKKTASDTWNGIKSIFSKVANWFNDTVIKPVKKFFTGMWDGLKTGASNAWSGIKSVFSKVASFFGDIFGKAWQKVKDVFSTGGKIFDGIKDGIVDAFKSIVNGIIRAINKIIAVPFNSINSILGKIKNVEVAGISPFKNLISNFSVPKIPELEYGGILKRGQIGLLEGKGDEAVIPLERNRGWIKNIASEILSELKSSSGNFGQLPLNPTSNVTNNFYQYNTSPKALSRLEIYRQTKNQLNFAKGG